MWPPSILRCPPPTLATVPAAPRRLAPALLLSSAGLRLLQSPRHDRHQGSLLRQESLHHPQGGRHRQGRHPTGRHHQSNNRLPGLHPHGLRQGHPHGGLRQGGLRHHRESRRRLLGGPHRAARPRLAALPNPLRRRLAQQSRCSRSWCRRGRGSDACALTRLPTLHLQPFFHTSTPYYFFHLLANCLPHTLSHLRFRTAVPAVLCCSCTSAVCVNATPVGATRVLTMLGLLRPRLRLPFTVQHFSDAAERLTAACMRMVPLPLPATSYTGEMLLLQGGSGCSPT